jgi:predicted DCC family thiol-disulfide oxidoreductase YuxK
MAKVLALDRRGALRPVALQSSEADALLGGMDRERKMASWHTVDTDGTVTSGGRALAPLLRALRQRRLADLVDRFPAFFDRAYYAVANRRTPLGRLIPARAKRASRARTAGASAGRSGRS